VQSARRGNKLAAFSAYVEDVATQAPERDNALAKALNQRKVMQCSQIWNHFISQVHSSNVQDDLIGRVALPSEALPPLP
jgi:hypothetical protein